MHANMSPQTGTRHSPAYQTLLVALLSLNFGIVFFDRNALNFLMPFVQPELGLSNTQVGLLASALSFTWALAALGVGKLSDALGRRKPLLIAATIAFSLCSFMSGLAGTFAVLLAARLLMGVAEGGIMPISHAIVARDVSPERRGMAQGVAQNVGSSLLGSTVAPIVLAGFAAAYGWREAFYLAGIPGIISALLMWKLIKETPEARPVRQETDRSNKASTIAVLMQRNILVCVLQGVLLVSFLVICWAFMPLYLTEVLSYSPETMGWVMGSLGLSSAFLGFLVSMLSDWIGRRPTMIVFPFVGTIVPLAALYFTGSPWGLATLFVLGWSLTGIFPLFMATVPSETADSAHVATALGLSMGVSEVLGGVFAPALAGVAADAYGLTAPLWIMIGLAVVSGFVALGLRESAPRLVGARLPEAAR